MNTTYTVKHIQKGLSLFVKGRKYISAQMKY